MLSQSFGDIGEESAHDGKEIFNVSLWIFM